MSELVGLPGIEPGLHAPHACVLPVYYSPPSLAVASFDGPKPAARKGELKSFAGFFRKCFNALRASQNTLACPARTVGKARFLEIGIFSFSPGGVKFGGAQFFAGTAYN